MFIVFVVLVILAICYFIYGMFDSYMTKRCTNCEKHGPTQPITHILKETPGNKPDHIMHLCKKCLEDFSRIDPNQPYLIGYGKFQIINQKQKVKS